MDPSVWVFALKVLFIITLVSFLPLTALSYFVFRRKQRELEVNRVFSKLKIAQGYEKLHELSTKPGYFILSVSFATLLSLLGLTVLFLGQELEIAKEPNILLGGPVISTLNQSTDTGILFENHQQGALLVFGMAFLGAYIWSLQTISRRYAMNDLTPVIYYHIGVRMIFSAIIALLAYHAVDTLLLGGDSDDVTAGKSATILPALAFIIGMFPQRGIRWMTDKFSFLPKDTHPSVQELPLEMIQGIESYDKERLHELGIDSCYDLALADFIPLIIKTPYGARELVDWILQAKLCAHFGVAVADLRRQGIRTILDLMQLLEDDQSPGKQEAIERLAKETQTTEHALRQVVKMFDQDPELKRLREAEKRLSRYWEDEPGPPADRPDGL